MLINSLRQSSPNSLSLANERGSEISGFSRALAETSRTLLVIAGITLLAGCSPKLKSQYFDEYTDIPAPPADARIQLSVSTEKDAEMTINYVVWDEGSKEFKRKDIHYSTTTRMGIGQHSDFQQRGGYLQSIRDGEVLTGGIVVDQLAGKLYLPGGNLLDGASGNVYKPNGELLKTLGN
jgi:hypothetical protein